MIPKRWKVAGITAAALGGLTGVALADNGLDLNDRSAPIALAEQGASQATATTVDVSPESADSPAESPFDSVESPTDSPDDPGYIDPSPESPDSPADSPFDSPAPSSGSDSPASPASPVSPESADSPGSADSPD